jgi:N-formylglutamate deformylase
MTGWLTVARAEAPLIVSVPHAGTEIPTGIRHLRSATLARQDADHHVDKLYAFAADLGATIISTAISRTVIDVNRDPSGASLYPGQVTTTLCPAETFDGEDLYESGYILTGDEISSRRARYFDPYHAAITAEVARLRTTHKTIVLYDAHSICSRVPRLFAGVLPQFNIGTFNGASCSAGLTEKVAAACGGDSTVINGRFKGGWITRHYGAPARGIHAIQMELAMRGYLDEAAARPPVWNLLGAAPMQAVLRDILSACLTFAEEPS